MEALVERSNFFFYADLYSLEDSRFRNPPRGLLQHIRQCKIFVELHNGTYGKRRGFYKRLMDFIRSLQRLKAIDVTVTRDQDYRYPREVQLTGELLETIKAAPLVESIAFTVGAAVTKIKKRDGQWVNVRIEPRHEHTFNGFKATQSHSL